MKRIVAFILAVTCCICLGAFASGDTLITLSYLNNTIKPDIENSVESTVLSTFKDVSAPNLNIFSKDGVMAEVSDRVLNRLQMQGYYMHTTSGMEEMIVKKDEIISGMTGTKIIVTSGSAVVANDAIINITAGTDAKSGSQVALNSSYMLPAGNGAGIKITSDRATVMVDGVYRIVSVRYRAKYFDRADALKAMDLFRGSNIGYELNRGATRAEGLVMLLRLLGEEDEALSYGGSHPFTDVPDWVDRYVAYAYYKGYTNGISKTLFGPNNLTTANHYMTFILRALSYDDAKGDFKWDKAVDFAKSLGNITEGEYNLITKNSFMRDHMAYLSYYSLFANLKASDTTLLDKLVDAGAVSRSVANKAIAKVTDPRL